MQVFVPKEELSLNAIKQYRVVSSVAPSLHALPTCSLQYCLILLLQLQGWLLLAE